MKPILIIFLFFAISKFSIGQITYTFTGNGNWSNEANWSNNIVPPQTIPGQSMIIINPAGTNECVVDILVNIPQDVNLKIMPGKKFRIAGDLLIHQDSTVVLNSNVHIIDTTTMILNSTAAMLNAGTYSFAFNSPPTGFNNGDVIISPSGNGYIRKINTYTTNGNDIIFQTLQGNMEDVFKRGHFDFLLATDSLGRNTTDDYTYSFNDLTLYQSGPLTIKLNNGNITLNPNWNFDFDFQNSQLNHFQMSCQNAVLNSSFEAEISASQAITLLDRSDTLTRLTKTFIEEIPVLGIPVPVIVVANLDFICKYSASLDAAVNTDITFNSSNNMNLGIAYSNPSWQPEYGLNSSNTITPTSITGNINGTINVALIPTFSFQFYGIAGPYASIGLKAQTKANLASPSLDWDFSAGAWLETKLGANANALGYSLFDFNGVWDTDTLFYKTPYSIISVSGDNQTGLINQYLPHPIKVRVLDNQNSPQSNVPVYFTVTAGAGAVQDTMLFTDGGGYAETLWQISSQFGIQTLDVIAKKANGTVLQSGPLEFAATAVNHLPPILMNNTCTQSYHASANCQSTVVSEGSSAIITYGFCWNTAPNPTLGNYKTTYLPSIAISNFSSVLTGLVSNTTYYVRAYAINSTDTGYSNEVIISSIRVGDTAFGGIVVYVDSSGQHGLVCALDDQSIGVSWDPDPAGSIIGVHGEYNDQSNLLNGAFNTSLIIDSLGNNGDNAASVCKRYNGGGFDDWFLPTTAALGRMCCSVYFYGGESCNCFELVQILTPSHDYWSCEESWPPSSPYAATYAYGLDGGGLKTNLLYVRAVRLF